MLILEWVFDDGRTSKLLRTKRNCSDPLCTALKVARPNNVAAERLLKTKMCFFFMTGRCGQACCKYVHGPRELKHALDLKNTMLIAMKICASLPAFTRLCHAISSNNVLARKVCGADTCMLSRTCDALSQSFSCRRIQSLGSTDPSSRLISYPRIGSDLQGRNCRQILRFPSLILILLPAFPVVMAFYGTVMSLSRHASTGTLCRQGCCLLGGPGHAFCT